LPAEQMNQAAGRRAALGPQELPEHP